jgi:hypothetical protein
MTRSNDKETRLGPISVDARLGHVIAWYRYLLEMGATQGHFGVVAKEGIQWPEPEMDIAEVQRVESELHTKIPDELLVYFAAGLAGERKTSPGAPHLELSEIVGLTETQREFLEEQALRRSNELPFDVEAYVWFDEDEDGNYYLFEAGSRGGEYYYFDRETSARDGLFRFTLAEFIERWANTLIEEYLDGANLSDDQLDPENFGPFEARLVGEPIASAQEQTESEALAEGFRVRHSKFGPGTVVEKFPGSREKWKIEFDSGDTKLMLAEFVELEESVGV